MKLRKYQNEILDYIEGGVAFGSTRICVEAPTGSGKSLMISELCKKYSDDKIVILVNVTKLVQQISDHLTLVGVSHSILKAGREGDYNEDERVQIWMEQTYHARKDKISFKPRIAIRDEHHIGLTGDRFNMFMAERAPEIVLGFSATPYDNKGVQLAGYEVAPGPSVKHLTEKGYLMPATTKVFPFSERIDLSKIGKSADYSSSELDDALNNDVYNLGVVNAYRVNGGGSKTIVFVSGTEHAEDLASMFRKHDISSYPLHSKQTTKMQNDIMSDFRGEGLLDEFNVLVSVSMLTTGFDMPDANVVILARPTKVRSLYIQMVGRVLRPDGDPLSQALILDCCQATREHGLYHKEYKIPKTLRLAKDALVDMKTPVVEWATKDKTQRVDVDRIIEWNKAAKIDRSLFGLAYNIKQSQSAKGMLMLGCIAYEKIWGVRIDSGTQDWILRELQPGVTSFGIQPFKTRMMNIIKGKKGKPVKMQSLYYFHKWLKENAYGR